MGLGKGREMIIRIRGSVRRESERGSEREKKKRKEKEGLGTHMKGLFETNTAVQNLLHEYFLWVAIRLQQHGRKFDFSEL